MSIQRLEDHVINQIAAGEVVERPASVVKELIENSLDAGANLIEVKVIDGGKELIEIRDNGRGIAKEDFPLVFERHATSKIQSLQDLEQVLSLGFRGEALASISSVAEVTVQSRAIDNEQGWTLNKTGIELGEPQAAAMNQGTMIRVSKLFAEVPARQKYLKGGQTEYRYIAETVLQHAAAHPEIHFRLIDNDKVKIDFPAGDLLSRAMAVLAVKDPELLIPVSYQSQDMQISGYLGKPQLAIKNRKKQLVAFNERPLQIPFVNRAVKDALHTLIPHDMQPIFVLNVMIDPTAIDINVHPRKLEARFAYQQFVYQKLKAAVKAATEKHVLTAKLELGTNPIVFNRPMMPSAPVTSLPQPSLINSAPMPRAPLVNQYQAFNEGYQNERQARPLSIQPVAQINKAYILGVDGEGLIVIDQHAAHERVRYARLQQIREQYRKGSEIASQRLLTPLGLDLSDSELAILKEYMEAVAAVGFEFEITEADAQLLAVPNVLVKDDLLALSKGLIADLQQTGEDGLKLNDLEARIERVINYTACRSAIKFGQDLTIEEMRALVAELDSIEQDYTCPHGRPTRICLSFSDLEKQFGR